MAGEALIRIGEHISYFKLIPDPHGKFDVRINGELVAEHQHEPDAHIFPELEDLLRAINERTAKAVV